MTIELGPAGIGKDLSEDLDRWEERQTDITRIFIYHDQSLIKAVQFVYTGEGGQSVLSEKYGNTTDFSIFEIVDLNYPSEYLSQLFGECDDSGI